MSLRTYFLNLSGAGCYVTNDHFPYTRHMSTKNTQGWSIQNPKLGIQIILVKCSLNILALERVRWKNTNPTTVEWVKQNYLEIFGKYNKQVQKYRAGMLVCGLLVGGLISRKLYQRYFKESERLYSITAISAKNILSVITRILEENKDYDSDARSSVENAKQDLQQIIQLNNSVQATSYTIFSTLATKLYRN